MLREILLVYDCDHVARTLAISSHKRMHEDLTAIGILSALADTSKHYSCDPYCRLPQVTAQLSPLVSTLYHVLLLFSTVASKAHVLMVGLCWLRIARANPPSDQEGELPQYSS